MVKLPEEYRWSSYHNNGWGDSGWVTPYDEYLRLGRGTEEHCNAYRELFKHQLNEADLHFIRKAAHYSQPSVMIGFEL